MDVFLADIQSINRFAEDYLHRVEVALPFAPDRRRAFLAAQLPTIERMLGNPLGQILHKYTRERLEALWLKAAEAAESGV
jgi:hypothetical protein